MQMSKSVELMGSMVRYKLSV